MSSYNLESADGNVGLVVDLLTEGVLFRVSPRAKSTWTVPSNDYKGFMCHHSKSFWLSPSQGYSLSAKPQTTFLVIGGLEVDDVTN
mgnify:CR=1 FL=1